MFCLITDNISGDVSVNKTGGNKVLKGKKTEGIKREHESIEKHMEAKYMKAHGTDS